MAGAVVSANGKGNVGVVPLQLQSAAGLGDSVLGSFDSSSSFAKGMDDGVHSSFFSFARENGCKD